MEKLGYQLKADPREMKYAGYGRYSQPILNQDGSLFADVYGATEDECENRAADLVELMNAGKR